MDNKEQTFLNKDNVIAIVGIIFFVVLALMVRLSPNDSTSDNKLDSTNGGGVNSGESVDGSSNLDNSDNEENLDSSMFSLLDMKNYHLVYSVEYNDVVEIIEGEVNGSKMKFSITGDTKQEYAKVLDAYLKLENGKYVTTNQEVRSYLEYLDIEKLKDVLRLSVSEVDDKKITYVIDTTDLLDEYTDLDYSGFEDFKDDSVVVTIDDDNKIKTIKIDYSNFFKYVNSENKTFKVSMQFDKFGSIEDLDI